MIKCQACATQNLDSAAYCTKCARKLDADTQRAVVEQRAAHMATGVRWVAVSVTTAVVIVIIVVVVLFVTGVV